MVEEIVETKLSLESECTVPTVSYLIIRQDFCLRATVDANTSRERERFKFYTVADFYQGSSYC